MQRRIVAEAEQIRNAGRALAATIGHMSGDPSETVVDARGLYCPIPVLRLARAILRQPSGAVVELLATDPAADADVSAFCREAGHTLVSREVEAEVTRYRVRRK
jgi:tRNA 2-thiouridine synthesizing protein A